MSQEITVYELEKRLNGSNPPILLDVREKFEIEITNIQNSIHIPMNQIPNEISTLDPKKNYVVYCRVGGRSAKVCEYLLNNKFESVKNLSGGINEWARQINPSLNVY